MRRCFGEFFKNDKKKSPASIFIPSDKTSFRGARGHAKLFRCWLKLKVCRQHLLYAYISHSLSHCKDIGYFQRAHRKFSGFFFSFLRCVYLFTPRRLESNPSSVIPVLVSYLFRNPISPPLSPALSSCWGSSKKHVMHFFFFLNLIFPQVTLMGYFRWQPFCDQNKETISKKIMS